MGAFLIAHRGALGDFIQTWPTLASLKLNHRNLHFIGLGRPEYMRLAKDMGFIDSFYNCESAEFLSFFNGESVPKILENLENALVWMDKGDKVVQLLTGVCKGRVHLHPPFGDGSVHMIEHHSRALSFFGLPEIVDKNPWYPIEIGESGYALVHPGSGSKDKNYDPEFYGFVANELRSGKYPDTKILLGPAEKNLKVRFSKDHPIAEVADVSELANLLGGAKLFIGNDSGVSHLAAVLGVNTIALYKGANHRVWGIRGQRVQCLEASNEAQAMSRIQKALELLPIRA